MSTIASTPIPPMPKQPVPQPAGIPEVYDGKARRWLWTYRDRDGAVFGHVARFDDHGGKTVIPYFRKTGGSWAAGAAAEPRTLFGLDSLPRDHGATVYIAEGEKAASALHSLRLPAVASQGGSKAANKTDWSPLSKYAEILILPDNDAPGAAYAGDVTALLRALPQPPKSVLIANLPGLPEKGDVVDWLKVRVPHWDGFGPVPREPGDELLEELIEAIEKAAVPAPLESSRASTPEPWDTPVPLDAAVLPQWPEGVFPDAVERFVHALAAHTETPPELPALMVLSLLSAAAQGRYRVLVKPGYFEPVNIWTCCALRSGSRKTAALEEAKRPLVAWEREERERMEPTIRRLTSERKTLEGRIEGLRRKVANANTQPAEVTPLMRQIEELEHDLPVVPALPQLWTSDITSEALAVLMSEHGERMALLCDEGGPFDNLAGRYSSGTLNLDVYLQAHAGSPVRVNRLNRGAVYLAHPSLTIGISPQPDVLAGFSNTPEFRGRGLLARFLYALPPSNLGTRSGDGPTIPDGIRSDYHNCIKAMLDHPSDADKNGELIPHVLRLAPDAATLWRDYWRLVETQMAPDGPLEHIPDWTSKLPGAVARVAALLHIARYAHDKPWTLPIGFKDMAGAVEIATALVPHALAVFDHIGADEDRANARALLAWIRRKGITAFARRDAHRGNQSRFQRGASLDAALLVLEDAGYIRPVIHTAKPGQFGRPASPSYEVNPNALRP